MKIIRHMTGMQTVGKPVCLAVGFFDGVHTGHQKVLRRTLARARDLNGEAWAMTFDPHPMQVLHPSSAPPILTSTPHKLDLLRRFGLDGCLLIPFTRRFSATPADTFLTSLERSLPTLSDIFIGEDWRFGRGGQGDTAQLAEWARSRGIRVTPVVLVRRHVNLVSSTRIRETISQGKLSLAARLIGRPFSILGTVMRGNRVGRQLGYPTANLAAHNEVRPPIGVYAVRAIVNRRAYAGLINFGHHPTVKTASDPVLELHLLDTHLNLYGRHIEVFFFARIRAERKFPSTFELTQQIRKDIRSAQRLLTTPRAKKLWNSTLQTWHPDIIVPTKKKAKRVKERAQG